METEDISHFSKPFVKASAFEDENELLSLLGRSAQGDIQLLSYYKNLPVCYEAELLNIERKIAEFRVHKYHAIIMNENKFTFMKHKEFEDNVVSIAKTQFIHVKKNI